MFDEYGVLRSSRLLSGRGATGPRSVRTPLAALAALSSHERGSRHSDQSDCRLRFWMRLKWRILFVRIVVVMESGASSQEVEVADEGTLGPQARSFVAEDLAYFVVQRRNFDKIEKPE